MTDEQILKLAKTCGFDEFVGEKDDETDGVYWQCWEEQLLKFARSLLEQIGVEFEYPCMREEE